QSQGTYSRPGVNDVLEEQHAFWLHTSKESTTHTFSGSSTKGLMTDLSLGWNLYSPVKEMPAPLGALSIWKWDTISKNYKPILAVDNLIPLTGYWIFMNQ
ncbi:MAG: hypothetical protein KAG98_07485, partial [Lentisphaeria bacterium]|nr:hypothetical protein [Lentisphaeria bacterium]